MLNSPRSGTQGVAAAKGRLQVKLRTEGQILPQAEHLLWPPTSHWHQPRSSQTQGLGEIRDHPSHIPTDGTVGPSCASRCPTMSLQAWAQPSTVPEWARTPPTLQQGRGGSQMAPLPHGAEPRAVPVACPPPVPQPGLEACMHPLAAPHSPPPPPSLAPPASHSLQAQGGSPTPQYPQTYHRASPAPNPAPRQGTPLSNTSGTKKPQQFLPITKLIPASPSHTHQCSQSQEHLH